MKKIKTIIIEDETRAQIFLKGIIELNEPEIEIVAICDDLPSGVLAIRKHNPELVFLDIEMPKYNGLEIGNFFNAEEMNFSIIFTTAYNQYAIQAFKTVAVDYLLKPIDAMELNQAIVNFKNKKASALTQLTAVNNELKNDAKIAIPDGNNLVILKPSDILYLKAESSYTTVHLLSGKKYVTSRFLKNYEESLYDYPQFFRCHKSFIVNTDYIVSYSKSDGGYLTLTTGIEVPISPDKTEAVLSYFTRVNR